MRQQDDLLVAEELAAKAVVNDLFDAMRVGDSALLRQAFHLEVEAIILILSNVCLVYGI